VHVWSRGIPLHLLPVAALLSKTIGGMVLSRRYPHRCRPHCAGEMQDTELQGTVPDRYLFESARL